MKKIGGEFEINIKNLNSSENKLNSSLFLYSNGRAALKAILRNYRKVSAKNVIHIPYYICSSVIETCISEGFALKFYEINSSFQLSIDYLDQVKDHEILFTVCYFGLVNDNEIITQAKKARPDIVYISDHVMSYWTCESSVADYAFTSFRKHFAIPEGAIIHAKQPFRTAEDRILENEFYKDKYLGAILKFNKVEDNLYLNFFQNGERLLDKEIENITKASPLANLLYGATDFERISNIRKANAKYVYDYGNEIGLDFVFPQLADTAIPQHIPIRVPSNTLVRKQLFSEGIFLPIHWEIGAYNAASEQANMMCQKSISLVIDQRYGIEDMKRMLYAIYKILKY